MKIQFDRPASQWIEALPVGNGPLGAMVFGTYPVEHIQVNEHTVWAGGPTDRVSPTGLQSLPEIRQLLFSRQYAKAQELVEKHMLFNCKLKAYQPLCSLLVSETSHNPSAEKYARSLDLTTGIHQVNYRFGDADFHRECFASLTDGVIVSRVESSEKGRINVIVRLDREQDVTLVMAEGNRLVLEGRLGADGVRFRAEAVLLSEGGRLLAHRNSIEVQGADSLTIMLTGSTNFVTARDLSGDPALRCQAMLKKVDGISYAHLRQAHLSDNQALMDRVELTIDGGEDCSTWPADRRLRAFGGGDGHRSLGDERLGEIKAIATDWSFYAMVFQSCRYALLASSMPGSQPSTLQGRWCGRMNPPWDSDYHPNINLQMNYWPANPCNLGECNQPLFDWLKVIAERGHETARRLYGCGGWVLHHVSDIFGTTEPMDGPFGVWPVGGAWVSHHLWEHYQFTQDRKFLEQSALPLLLGSAEFFLDFLVEGPAETPYAGRLVTAPSHSPENTFFTDDRKAAWICVSATMDTQIIGQLLRNCLSALQITGRQSPLQKRIQEAIKLLPPMQISPKTGRLMEWFEDFGEPEPGHRHMSHMFAIYPGDGITPTGNPDLSAAARKSIEYRLAHDYDATGWSLPWMACIYARLGDGNKALEMLTQRVANFTMPNIIMSNAHGQPQVGDACGFAAAIAEILLQSHEGFIHLLPALPDVWRKGCIRGLCARGGFEVEIEWADGRLSKATIRSQHGGVAKVRYFGQEAEIKLSPGETQILDSRLTVS